jgi:lactoylglutathione lyase
LLLTERRLNSDVWTFAIYLVYGQTNISTGNVTSAMTDHVPVRGLFETHLTVSDLRRSIAFYRDIIGLQVALEVPQRNAAFFSVGDSRTLMLGLWSPGTAPLGFTLHVTFEVALDDFLEAPKHLKAQGITPLSFFGLETTEPSVIGWLPAAFISFRDPDGHLIGLPGGHSLVQLAYPN